MICMLEEPIMLSIAGCYERTYLRNIFEEIRDAYHKSLKHLPEKAEKDRIEIYRKGLEFCEYMVTALNRVSSTILITSEQKPYFEDIMNAKRKIIQDVRKNLEKKGDYNGVEVWSRLLGTINYFLDIIKDPSKSHDRPIVSIDHKCSGKESDMYYTQVLEYPVGTKFCRGCDGVLDIPKSPKLCICGEKVIWWRDFSQHCKDRHPNNFDDALQAILDEEFVVDNTLCMKCGESVGSARGFLQHIALKHPGEIGI